MQRFPTGTAATLEVIYTNAAGVPVDPTPSVLPTPDVAVGVLDKNSSTVIPVGTAATRVSTGVYTYTLTAAQTASPTVLTATWATADGDTVTYADIYAAFVSPQDLVDYLGRGDPDDPGVAIAVESACGVVQGLAEQTFHRVIGETISLDGSGTDAMLLPELPVTSVGQVLVDGGTITDYALNGNGILFRGTAGIDPRPVWPMGRQNVTITYDHGYALLDVPRAVQMVALSLAARIAVQGAATEEQLGSSRVKYAGPAMDLTVGEKAILAKYRQRR